MLSVTEEINPYASTEPSGRMSSEQAVWPGIDEGCARDITAIMDIVNSQSSLTSCPQSPVTLPCIASCPEVWTGASQGSVLQLAGCWSSQQIPPVEFKIIEN